VALAFIAAHTKTIRLATGIIILPQRNPLVLAKELASVDVVSGGRLVFGIGVGYLKPEFDALNVPFERKGRRADEYLEAMLAMWTQEKPAYRGEFVSFGGIDAQPRPVQKPHPPIVIGGSTPAAFRRAVRRGNGWYGYNMDLDATRGAIAALREAEKKVDRPGRLGRLEITVSPPPALGLDEVPRYEELGVDRVVLLNFRGSEDDLVRFVDDAASRLLRRRP
jgi:probable F420-dependent oxidoreductase